jgi:long-chain acyl-CoA synthetase
MGNLAAKLVETARRHPDRIAVKLEETEVPYAALDAASAHLAGLLRARGLAPGDRVGVMLPNVPQFAVLYYGILRAGAVVVPMDVLLTEREVAYCLCDTRARFLFAWYEVSSAALRGAAGTVAEVTVVRSGEFEQFLGQANPDHGVAQVADEDTAMLLYTAPTTGRPKAAELTHGTLARNVEVIVDHLARLTENDVIFAGLPLCHASGQTRALNAAIRAGACLTLLPRFDARRVLQILAEDRVTVLEGAPRMYLALLGQPDRELYDLSTLRVCISGGRAMPVQVRREVEKVFGALVEEGYALSETSPPASSRYPDPKRNPGPLGTPIRGVRMCVVDEQVDELSPGEASGRDL